MSLHSTFLYLFYQYSVSQLKLEDVAKEIGRDRFHILVKSSNLVRIGCKTHVLYHLIRDCHTNILLKIQNILPHEIISR